MKGFKRRLRLVRAFFKLAAYQFRALFHLFYGVWRISQLTHVPVTIFGGARLTDDSIYMKKARDMAFMFAKRGIPVLTGGGPGIMEAASCGAGKVGGAIVATIGITVEGLEANDERTTCHQNVIVMKNFAARKWLLINFSRGFVVFPGGFGTLNELTELLTLIQTKKRKKAPIILIGVEYWKPFMAWLKHSALAQGLISKEDEVLFRVTDDMQEAIHIIEAAAPPDPFNFV